MRKGWLAVVVVAVVVGAGYLGAQAYSSHVFERELVRTLDTLRADGRWRVEREAVERGWFHSSGRLRLTQADDGDWWASVPYDARHGLLSTRLSGALQFYALDDGAAGDERALFGALLPSAEPRWTATFHTLERRGEGRLDIAAFELTRGAERFVFTGAELNLEGRAGDVTLQGQVAPLRLERSGEEVVTGPLHINGRYRLSGDGRSFHQRNELILERLEYQGRQRPPVTLSGLRYSDETRLDEQLRVEVSLSLEQARMAGETLLSGRLAANLERIDGDAVRRLLEQLEAAIDTHGGDLTTLDQAQRRALIERLEPAILATLTDSPRFVLEGMTLASPLFGVDTRGHGELTFDGEGSETLSVVELYRGDTQAWRERLNGRFTWQGVPPLLALQLGLPPDTRKLEVSIDAGEVRINGHALPPLL